MMIFNLFFKNKKNHKKIKKNYKKIIINKKNYKKMKKITKKHDYL